MGQRESRANPISFEEAVSRMSPEELKRVRTAFKRTVGLNNLMTKNAFVREVFGDAFPSRLAEEFYELMGGGNKGISFKDLVSGLAVLTKGSPEERVQLLFALFSADGHWIQQCDMDSLILTLESGGHVPRPVRQLFNRSSTPGRVSYEVFRSWMGRHSHVLQLSKWLLDCSALQLTESGETPTYQKTIGEVTGLQEQDVCDLERRFYTLKLYCKAGQFNSSALTSVVSPPIPEILCEGLFGAFDANKDGLVEFKELCSAVSMCCRGSHQDKLKFSFRVFDCNQDGMLSEEELCVMVDGCLQLRREGEVKEAEDTEGESVLEQSTKEMVQELLETSHATEEKGITLDQYLKWAETSWLIDGFLDVLYQVCHLVLGLRPLSSQEEGMVIKKWMTRSEKRGLQPGDTLYLVAMSWWKAWKQYVQYDGLPDMSKMLQSSKSDREALTFSGGHQLSDCKANGSAVPSTSWNTLPKHWKPGSVDSPVHSPTAAPASPFPGKSKAKKQSNSGKSAAVDGAVRSARSKQHKGRRSATPDVSLGRLHSGGGKHQKLSGYTSDGSMSPSSSGGRHHRKAVNHLPAQPDYINNSSLCEPETRKNLLVLTSEGARLKKSVPLAHGIDFELLPEPVWRSLSEWYKYKICLPRSVIVCPHTHKPELELYPQILHMYRHSLQPQKSASNWAGVGLGFLLGGSSSSSSSNSGSGNNASGMDRATGNTKRVLSYYAAFSKTMTVKQMVEYIQGRLRVRPEDIRLWDINDEANIVLLDEDDERMIHELHWVENHKILIETRNRDLSWPEELMSLMNSKGKEKKLFGSGGSGIKGVTGLSNLGNTCFMNSALQCMSNTQPLTGYFLQRNHLYDLNKTNPLGMQGRIAKRYGDLVQDLWGGESWNVAPLRIRWTIGRYSPRFNGFQQHDSQELLAFLLDGLHEDLNRVHEKPYVELKDSNGRPDEEVAAEAWDNHLKRNRSVVVDLFQGQLRSQVVCQVCGHESVRFDPFTFLSLPLPMENIMYLEVIVVRLDGSVPVKYGLRLKTGDKYRQLREALAELAGIDLPQLLLVELFAGTVRSLPNDSQKVKLLGGYLYAFEVPVYTMRDSATPESDTPEEVKPETEEPEIEEPEIEEPEIEEPEIEELQDTVIDDVVPEEKPQENGEHGQMDGQEKRQRTQSCLSEMHEVTHHPLTPVRTHGGTVASDHPPQPVAGASSAQAVSTSVYDRLVVALHRKMIHVDAYLLAHQRSRPSLFGTPIITPCTPSTRNKDLYRDVMKQVARLLSREEATGDTQSRETDEVQYPFVLRTVHKDGLACSVCPWYRMCRGCTIECNNDMQSLTTLYIAIDWDPKEIHLRYLPSQERAVEDHSSIELNRKQDIEPINLDQCFEAFTKEEELGEEESWYCSRCKKHQTATKKMNIWKLPPVLIIHLKRFQFVNNRWAKSLKVVRFPMHDFNPSQYVYVSPTSPVASASPPAVQSTELIQSPSLQRQNPPDPPLDTPSEEQPAAAENEERTETPGLKTDEQLKNWVVVENVEGTCVGDDQCRHVPGRPVRVSTESSVDRDSPSSGALSDADGGEVSDELNGHSVERRTGHRFDLYAISSHAGILGGGHYVTFAKNPNGKWYIYNDSSCKESTAERVANESPYLLFYQCQDFVFNYQPDKTLAVDLNIDDDEYNTDARRFCVIQ